MTHSDAIQMVQLLARIAHALESVAKAQDPHFKPLEPLRAGKPPR
jgi:hypothetical protein